MQVQKHETYKEAGEHAARLEADGYAVNVCGLLVIYWIEEGYI